MMKKILNRPKRNWHIKELLPFFASLYLLLFPSCNKIETEQNSLLNGDLMHSTGIDKIDKVTYGKLKDVEGNVYKTVKIGKQYWMAENLKTTKLNDGVDIPEIKAKEDWYAQSEAAYCWYDNDPENKEDYGALYNWYAVNTGKLCPTGWHVSKESDWTTLINYLGQATAGLKIREVGDAYWELSEFAVATNESGFSARGAGVRWFGDLSDFFLLRYRASWWMSDEYDDLNAYFHNLRYDFPNMRPGAAIHPKVHGNSVRCVKH